MRKMQKHIVADGKNRVIVGLSVTPANSSEHNSAVEVIDKAIKNLHTTPEVVCVDTISFDSDCDKL